MSEFTENLTILIEKHLFDKQLEQRKKRLANAKNSQIKPQAARRKKKATQNTKKPLPIETIEEEKELSFTRMIEKSDLDQEFVDIIKTALSNPKTKNGKRVLEMQELYNATQDAEGIIRDLVFLLGDEVKPKKVSKGDQVLGVSMEVAATPAENQHVPGLELRKYHSEVIETSRMVD